MKIRKAKDIIAYVASLFILWRGLVHLLAAADEHNPYRVVLAFTFIAIVVLGLWTATNAGE